MMRTLRNVARNVEEEPNEKQNTAIAHILKMAEMIVPAMGLI